jgi:tripartite-type tricarboxylate transporter receptor subunit TctC
MKLPRRQFLRPAAGAAAMPALSHAANAQTYPSRPITLIAPWPAGGAIDALCRAIAPGLSDRLGKPVVVDNRPGAASVIGTTAGVRATPDGHTLTMGGSGALAIAVTLNTKLAYDPTEDIVPIALAGRIPFVLVVNPSLPIASLADLIKYAKNNPGKLSYGSGGPGSLHHLFAELFTTMADIEMTHVPYKGNTPALSDVIAGHVPLMFSDTASLPMIQAGKVRALGVSSALRLPSAPDIPPLAEGGLPEFDVAGWGMIIAPAGTPDEVASKVHMTFRAVEALPEVQQQVIKLGIVPGNGPPRDQLPAFISTEIERWRKVIVRAGLAGSQR